jgi:hypothetical protein
MRRAIIATVAVCSVLAALLVASIGARIVYRRHDIWLPGYVSWWWNQPAPAERTHLLVLFADHWEPATFYERASRWEDAYPQLADRHRDSNGRPLQHTWFYPVEQPYRFPLDVLKRLVERGYGEVEMHLHHHSDTVVSLVRKLRLGLELFHSYGFAKTITGQTRFAFVHGNFNLDGTGTCGVAEELRLLFSEGCFADYTFPALWKTSQPSHVNQLRYIVDTPETKSYDRGEVVAVGGVRPPGALVLFPGPLSIAYAGLTPQLVRVEDAHIRAALPATPARVDQWVRTAVQVSGRPEWVFIKLWGHGAGSDGDVEDMLDGSFDRALEYLEQTYNDGRRYVLHYVTAREAYNVAMAAAAGMSGDPACYYDWEVPPYQASAQAPRTVSPAGCVLPAPAPAVSSCE